MPSREGPCDTGKGEETPGCPGGEEGKTLWTRDFRRLSERGQVGPASISLCRASSFLHLLIHGTAYTEGLVSSSSSVDIPATHLHLYIYR